MARFKFLIVVLTFPLFFCSTPIYAGSSDIKINCKSASGRTLIYGSVPGDSAEYNLKIKVDNAVLQYRYGCSDVACKKNLHKGNLYVVQELSKKVFVIVLANKSGVEQGKIYAIPSTIKYKSGENKFSAYLKVIYYGLDPRMLHKKPGDIKYVKDPITLYCNLKYEI